MNIHPMSALLREYILILCSDKGFKPKHELVLWLWRRSWDWKDFQSDWLSLCPVQGGELIQLAGDLKVPGSLPRGQKALSQNMN